MPHRYIEVPLDSQGTYRRTYGHTNVPMDIQMDEHTPGKMSRHMGGCTDAVTCQQIIQPGILEYLGTLHKPTQKEKL